MATFLEVCRAVAPEARPVGEGPAAASGTPGSSDRGEERTVGWVRVLKPRVPAFDALDPGDLAIVPAHALAYVAPGEIERETLADGLATAGVAGVLLLETEDAEAGSTSAGSPSAGSPPAHLAMALGARGVPALVGRGDASALERSAIAYLVNRRAGLERLAGELERRVERLVLAGRGPDDIAAAIGAFVGRPVVVERRRGEPLAIHASVASNEVGAAAVTSAVARYHARPSDVPFRLPLPGPDGRPIGALVILGAGPVGERERVAAERVSTVVALALGRIPGLVAPAVGREGLPSAGPPWVVVLGRQERPGVERRLAERPAAGAAVVEAGAVEGGGVEAVRADAQAGADAADARADAARAGPAPAPADSLEAREAVRAEIALVGGPDRVVLRGDASSIDLRAVVAIDPDEPSGRALVERIAGVLGRTVGVSRRFDEPTGRPAAEAEARTTLEAAERLPDADRPLVARAERLSAYRILGDLAHLPDGLRESRALLAPLLTGSQVAQRDRLATLRAVLEHDGTAGVAAALGVHRNTVAYRLRSIERLGGWDLTDPDLRLALSIAVRVVQSAQSHGA